MTELSHARRVQWRTVAMLTGDAMATDFALPDRGSGALPVPSKSRMIVPLTEERCPALEE